MRFAVLVFCAAASADWFATAFGAFKVSAPSQKELVADLTEWQKHESDPAVFQKINAQLAELAHAGSAESLEDKALEEALGDAPAPALPAERPAVQEPAAASAVAAAPAVAHEGKHIHDMWNWKPVSTAADDAATKAALAPLAGAGATADAVGGLDTALERDGEALDLDKDIPPPAVPAPRPRRPALPAVERRAAPAAYTPAAAPAPADMPPAAPPAPVEKNSYASVFAGWAMPPAAPAPAVPRAPMYTPPVPSPPVATAASLPALEPEEPKVRAPPVETAEERALLHPAPKREDKVEAEQARIRAQMEADKKALAAPAEVPLPHAGPVEGKADSDPELASIQQENPMAYGMVKALLLKKSMGLIKSRADEPAPRGPVDMFNWKPQDSAADLVGGDDDSAPPPLALSASASTVSTASASTAPATSSGGDLSQYLGVHKAEVRGWDLSDDSTPAAAPPAPAVEFASPPAPVVRVVAPAAPAAAPAAVPGPVDMWHWQPTNSATDLLTLDPDNKGPTKALRSSRSAAVSSQDASTSSVLDEFMHDLD